MRISDWSSDVCSSDLCAARPHRADEAVDPATSLLPYFGTGGLVMGRAGRDIFELVGPDRAIGLGLRQARGVPLRHLHVIVGVGVRNRRDLDQLGAERAKRVLLLLALRLGDDDDGAHAERVGDHGEADAGIAGSALDNDAAGLQHAAGERVADDIERRPRSEEHTSELQSLMRISYAVFCLKKKKNTIKENIYIQYKSVRRNHVQ